MNSALSSSPPSSSGKQSFRDRRGHWWRDRWLDSSSPLPVAKLAVFDDDSWIPHWGDKCVSREWAVFYQRPPLPMHCITSWNSLMRERWQAYKHEVCIFFKLLGPVCRHSPSGPLFRWCSCPHALPSMKSDLAFAFLWYPVGMKEPKKKENYTPSVS